MADQDQIVRRQAMVNSQIRKRGINSPVVLDAMQRVAREAFVPDDLRGSAYNDRALPIAAGQTISQPYMVAMMIDALDLKGGERVLDVGTGSGYAAAVISCIAEKVYSIERINELAEKAKDVLLNEGYSNIEIRVGDGSLGWPEAAPFDAIAVAAGAPRVPEALKHQLSLGGRLVLPVGSNEKGQKLLRITRIAQNEFASEELAAVRFVPLIGEGAWEHNPLSLDDQLLVNQIAQTAESFDSISELPLTGLLERIGDSRLVLLGEASHGTSEFYQARHRITRALIEKKGFDFVAIEGDWPDVARIDHYVRHKIYPQSERIAFTRFPTWMWRNEDVRDFVDWLREYNASHAFDKRIAFHGLDMYSLYLSITAVIEYLEDLNPKIATFARERYQCLMSFESDPAAYARCASDPNFKSCKSVVLEVLHRLLLLKNESSASDSEQFFDAVQNARLVVSAEAYYSAMHDPSQNTWNLRDTHMFDTLEALLAHHGKDSRGVVWAHNSHIGDARATEKSRSGEINVGQLCRERFGEDSVYLIGFGTNTGTVAAASNWGESMEIKTLRPALANSYERLFHATGKAGFILPLGRHSDSKINKGLLKARLERAIGVIYRPETERASHYSEAQLVRQFDEYIWVDHSSAVVTLNNQDLV